MTRDKPLLHHVLIAAQELDRSRRFYGEVLELEEIDRPVFPYDGAWFELANNQHLHILVRSDATLRGEKNVDSFDVHFALRIKSYRETVGWLQAKGFCEHVPGNDIRKMILNPDSITGYAQIYILDPDRNVIEFNCERLD
jgi:glyoxylase I family protein